MNPLNDKEFLKELDLHRDREVFARILSLTFIEEKPLQLIEGRVSTGSINIDGTSAVRRTCSLTLTPEDEVDINEYYWGLKNKFKLEIGIKNTINSKYPNIIWFPQGIYVITAFNISQSTNNCSISISGKDKMCLLNGDVSGSLTASIDFGVEEYYDEKNNITTYTKIPIKKIIREAVHTYASEMYHNIILNDLDEVAVELLEYQGDTPIYMCRDNETDMFINYTLYGDQVCYLDETLTNHTSLEKIKKYDQRISTVEIDDNYTPTIVYFEGAKRKDTDKLIPFTIAKIEYGDTAGYRRTELTYAGDLISNVGEALTSIFDKIKNMLGEYEYFYDLDGRFVFQKKKIYVNTSWNNVVKAGDELYVDSTAYTSSFTYSFEDSALITSFQNNPNLTSLKNDYSIWGARTGVSGAEIPIHYRYAVDEIPYFYRTIKGKEYSIKEWDWREIIYQMALDYYQYNQEDDFCYKLAAANRNSSLTGDDLYATGLTGYEQYYTDLQGFWRTLYNPFPKDEEVNDFYPTGHENQYWNKQVYENPASLNFWFDFLDTNDDNKEISQYSVKAIGSRTKSVNDKDVKAIYFKETPNIIFTTAEDWIYMDDLMQSGYTPVTIPTKNLEGLFNISSQGKSAKDALDELLYNYLYCVESVNIFAVPVYYLQPNTRVYINDIKSKINGEYIVSKITLPLTYNGTMSITATKAPERLY